MRGRHVICIWLLAVLLLGACGEDEEIDGSCTSSIDCLAGGVCIDGSCQDQEACFNDGACPEGMICRDGHCTPGEKETDGDLPPAVDGDVSPDGDIVPKPDGDEPTDGDEDNIQPPDGDSESLPDGDPEPGEEPPDGDVTAEVEEEEPGILTASKCWEHKSGDGSVGTDYDQYNPIIGSHCMGTNHQDITGIEKVVFLGDSVTEGTPPTPFWQYYRFVLSQMLEQKFGPLEISECSEFGARVDDLLLPPHQQILTCFPSLPVDKKTLVIMTIGGNDLHSWVTDFKEGSTIEQIMEETESTIQLMDNAIGWFFEDPERFPKGVSVITSNIYEFTDATGDLNACLVSIFTGLGGTWPEGVAPTIRFNEAFMEITVKYQIDMIFMLENFCGHGFHNLNPASQCFIPPNGGDRWFDLTCIHPNPTGHYVIADMFMKVVNE